MPSSPRLPASPGEATRAAARDLAACLQFFSRLPLPRLSVEPSPHAAPDLSRLARMVPIAGAILGAIGALALSLADGVGLPPFLCAGLAIGALVILSGALHEDGLADVADGFGGGATRERKLEIMRDSRIGAYGAAALALSLLLRVAALSGLLEHGLGAAAAGLVLAGAASRAFALLARAEGLGVGAGRLGIGGALAAGVTALIIAGALGLSVLGLGRAILSLALAIAAALAMTALARRQIGGQTGDVAGAAQQLAEIACLCGLLIGRSGA
jgi:adenosylcobinamide-GDP ribazoletransferase